MRTRFHVSQEGRIPLNKKAYANKKITAWICGNDRTAFAACDFLKKQNSRPGRDISIMGFDNLPGALAIALTSVDFNVAQIGREALQYVLDPPRSSKEKRMKVCLVQGFVAERESTGEAIS